MVSIIIPTYNSKEFLVKTVESALKQTYTNVEIIIINDGSTDGSEELFPEFEKKGIICKTQSNLGASAARNFGLSIAKGEYIQFLDADDLLHPEKLQMQVIQMVNKGVDLSFTFWGNFTYSLSNVQPFKYKTISFSSLKNGKDILQSFGRDNWIILPIAWLVKRELIQKAGFWNEHISNNDDGEYFSRILFWAKSVVVIEKQLAYYRVGNANTLSSLNTRMKVVSALNSWKLIHALMNSSSNSKLLSYPKRGFYVNFLMTKKHFPDLSKQFAKEFDSIESETFLNEWRLFPLIKYLGLRRGYAAIRVLKKIVSVYKSLKF